MSDYKTEMDTRRKLARLSDEEFYAQNPELLPFDNGEGVFTASENKDVEISEFKKYGTQKLASSFRFNV